MKRCLLALLVTTTLSGCHGDWLGPIERGARAAFNGWDMWDTPSVRPYEAPLTLPVEGTQTVERRASYQQAVQQMTALSPAEQQRRAALTYRRFCHHCHGSNGDGRIIVGESFDVTMPDLRNGNTPDLDDEQLYDFISGGSGAMLALESSMTPLERALVIPHVRTLTRAPTQPFFPPRAERPLK